MDLLSVCSFSQSESEARTTAAVFKCVFTDSNSLSQKEESGASPLHLAVLSFRLYLVKLLLSFGADPNALTNHGDTPLHWAARCGEVDIIEELIRSGADVSARDLEGCTPLHWAAEGGHYKAAKFLIAWGASPSHQNMYDEEPADMFLASSNPRLYRLLVKNK